MKVWLDDERMAPYMWCWVKTAKDAKYLIDNYTIYEISLDHDLGDEKNGNGYEVICHLEKKAYENKDFHIPIIHIHTANPSARVKMELCLDQIMKIKGK